MQGARRGSDGFARWQPCGTTFHGDTAGSRVSFFDGHE
jgi:hypothetical protein